MSLRINGKLYLIGMTIGMHVKKYIEHVIQQLNFQNMNSLTSY